MGPILCVGAATWDIVLSIPAFPPHPTKVLADRCVETTAGMASAAAMTIASLGGNAAILARLGEDEIAQRWLAGARGAGVDTSPVEQVPGAKSGVSTIIVNARGERLIVPYYDAALTAHPPRMTDSGLSRFDAFLVDTRWPDASKMVLRHAAAHRRIALLDADVAAKEILDTLVPLASHVVFSGEALRSLCVGSDDLARLRNAQAMTPAMVGVTSGSDGCLLLIGETPVRVPAPKVDAVDTLAAGDVFHGAFLLGLTEGMDPACAARFANAAAALKCTRFGGIAGRPNRSEVDALLAGSDAKAPSA